MPFSGIEGIPPAGLIGGQVGSSPPGSSQGSGMVLIAFPNASTALDNRSRSIRAGKRVWVLQATTTRRLTSGVSRVFGMGAPRLSKSCYILLGSPSMIGSVGVAMRLSGIRCGVELGNDVTRIAVVWLVDTAVRGLAACQTAGYWQGLWQSWSLYLS